MAFERLIAVSSCLCYHQQHWYRKAAAQHVHAYVCLRNRQLKYSISKLMAGPLVVQHAPGYKQTWLCLSHALCNTDTGSQLYDPVAVLSN